MSRGNQISGGVRENAAKALLRVMPRVMQAVRTEMRASRTIPLSVPQFRALYFIGRREDPSLSDVAAFVGVALPTMSRLVNGLVERKLVARCGHADDRRRLTLRLTERGQGMVQAAHAFTEASLAARLSPFRDAELSVILRAMELLLPVFSGDGAEGTRMPVAKKKSNGDAHG